MSTAAKMDTGWQSARIFWVASAKAKPTRKRFTMSKEAISVYIEMLREDALPIRAKYTLWGTV